VANIADVIWQRAAETPVRVGLIVDGGDDWSYSGIASASNRMAARLADALADVGAADRKALVFLQNSPIMVFTLLGLWRARITAVPINVMYKTDEIRHAVSRAKPTVAVTTRDHAALLRDAGFTGRVITVDDTGEAELAQPCAFDPPVGLEQVDAIVLFTGGSTGQPKAVTVTHEGFGSSLDGLVTASKGGRRGPYPLVSDEVPPNLVYFPLFHAGGINSLLFAWTVGRRVVLMERFRAERVVDLVQRYHVDNLFLLPTMMFDLLQVPQGDDALKSVRTVLSSGQELNPVLRRRFEEKFRIPIQSNYGSTEVGHVAGWTMHDIKAGRWTPGAVGLVYDGVEVEIRDEDGRPVPTGEIGELWVKTDVTRGYLNEQGNEGGLLIVDGWVRSRDVGYLDTEGRLFLAGRARDMIKCGGFQVWPSELEEAILHDPLVQDVAVLSAKDERLGEIPVAFVVLAAAVADQDVTQRVVSLCRERLAHYKVPRKVVRVSEIPRNDAGKTDKPKLAASLPAADTSAGADHG
jgi:long-chain acyl-CoA synthetase